MKFQDDKRFMEAVEKNNIFVIKSCLERFINKFSGDQTKCDEAINYARSNSSFDWEKEDGIEMGSGVNNNIEEKYLYERERLVQNFTRERYEKVLSLYRKYKGIQEKIKEEPKNTDFSRESKNEEIKSEKIKTEPKIPLKKKQRKLDQEEKTMRLRVGILAVGVIILVVLLIKAVF